MDASNTTPNAVDTTSLSGFNQVSDAIISLSTAGHILSWNKEGEVLFGFSQNNTEGKNIVDFCSKENHGTINDMLSTVASGQAFKKEELNMLTAQGDDLYVVLFALPYSNRTHQEDTRILLIINDITPFVEHKKAVIEENRVLNLINSASVTISSKLDVDAVLQKVTDVATELTGADYGTFWYNTMNANGEALLLYTISGAPKSDFEHLGMPRITKLFAETFTHRKTLRLDDVTQYHGYGIHGGPPKGHPPVKSYMSVPVISRSNENIGTLLFAHGQTAAFTEEHEDMVKKVAAQAAVAIDNSRLYERVYEMNSKKDEFIALASHELKTPLTTIKGYLQLLEDMVENPEKRMLLNTVLEQSEKLSNLVGDLLDISKIQKGKLELNFEPFSMNELVEKAKANIEHVQSTHKVNIALPDSVVTVEADKFRIEQVLTNLVSNAIKYSPNKEHINIKLNAQDGYAIVAVKDYGIGMDKEHLTNIFNRFYRVKSDANISGLGLGLYLSKEIIKSHDATIVVDSEKGKGSEFIFSLPLKRKKV